MIACEKCGTPFGARDTRNVFCSRRCRDAKYRDANRKKRRLHNRSYYAEHRDSYAAHRLANREGRASYRKRNSEMFANYERTRRARKRGAVGSFTAVEWEAIKQKQRGRCAACKKRRKLTADHITPLSRGGNNMAHNIRGLCLPCNSSKGPSVLGGHQYSLFDGVAAPRTFCVQLLSPTQI